MTRLLSQLLLQVSAGLGLLLGLAGAVQSQPTAVRQAEDLVRRALWAEVAGRAVGGAGGRRQAALAAGTDARPPVLRPGRCRRAAAGRGGIAGDPGPGRGSGAGFPPGTLVWTELGPVAIEQIRPGDRVLSQDPESGELAYKVVTETTQRPPSPILRMALDGMAMETTRGHLFWRVGDGWRMAKELQSGDRLHGLAGAVTVAGVTERPSSPAYNLVVEGFATYFVGQSRLLVHDNTARQVTAARLPGLIEE